VKDAAGAAEQVEVFAILSNTIQEHIPFVGQADHFVLFLLNNLLRQFKSFV
jgi:hypothetical protein